jgi:NADH-quinone oxidoreductase subunit G
VNSRIRKQWLRGGYPVAVVGQQHDLTYDYDYLGAGPDTLNEIANGNHPFAKVLEDAKRPMLIIGMGALARDDGAAILAAARAIAEKTGMVTGDWNGFNVLHTAAARVGGLDLGFVPGNGGRDTAGILDGAAAGDVEVVYLLGADEIDTAKLKNAFVVYQGHHGDTGAHAADVILPGAAYTEKNGTYVNTEGRVQLARQAGFPPGDAREDWTIIRALSAALGKALPFDDLAALRRAMHAACPHFTRIDELEPVSWGDFGAAGAMSGDPFVSPIANFYMTDPISRSSETMAQCTREFVNGAEGATGTHG